MHRPAAHKVARAAALVGGLAILGLLIGPAYVVELRLTQAPTGVLQNLNLDLRIPVAGFRTFGFIHAVLVLELVLVAVGVVLGKRLLTAMGGGSAVVAVITMMTRPPDPLLLAEAVGKALPTAAENSTAVGIGWGLWATLGMAILLVASGYVAAAVPLRRVEMVEQPIGSRIVKSIQYQTKPAERSRAVDGPHTHSKPRFVARAKSSRARDEMDQ